MAPCPNNANAHAHNALKRPPKCLHERLNTCLSTQGSLYNRSVMLVDMQRVLPPKLVPLAFISPHWSSHHTLVFVAVLRLATSSPAGLLLGLIRPASSRDASYQSFLLLRYDLVHDRRDWTSTPKSWRQAVLASVVMPHDAEAVPGRRLLVGFAQATYATRCSSPAYPRANLCGRLFRW